MPSSKALTATPALRISVVCAALSLDAVDVSGEQGGDISLAKNGQLHKIRLDPTGQRLTVAEYVSPRHWGFTLHKPRAVRTAAALPCMWHHSTSSW